MFKKNNVIIILLIVVLMFFSTISQAIYFPEDIDDEVIEEAIEIGEEFREATDFGAISKSTNHLHLEIDIGSPVKGIIFRTPFLELIRKAHEASRKYKEISENEIREILSINELYIEQIISSDDKNDVKSEDLHTVIKIPKKVTNKDEKEKYEEKEASE